MAANIGRSVSLSTRLVTLACLITVTCALALDWVLESQTGGLGALGWGALTVSFAALRAVWLVMARTTLRAGAPQRRLQDSITCIARALAAAIEVRDKDPLAHAPQLTEPALPLARKVSWSEVALQRLCQRLDEPVCPGVHPRESTQPL